MPGFLHNCAVNKLIRTIPGFKTKGFCKALRHEFYRDLSKTYFIPDGYVLSDRDGFLQVDIYEVEVTTPISRKFKDFMAFYEEMDCIGEFYMNIHIIDRWGNEVTVITDDDIQPFWAQYLRDERYAYAAP